MCLSPLPSLTGSPLSMSGVQSTLSRGRVSLTRQRPLPLEPWVGFHPQLGRMHFTSMAGAYRWAASPWIFNIQ